MEARLPPVIYARISPRARARGKLGALAEGTDPKRIAEKPGVSLRTVQGVKAEMGMVTNTEKRCQ